MSFVIVRVLIYAVIAAMLYFGLRKIFLDWRNRFKEMDQQTRERDLKERDRPDVVDLKKDEDGVFRPDDKNDKGRKS